MKKAQTLLQKITTKLVSINAFICTAAYLMLLPSVANAGILSSGICRPYRQLVDNELFVVVSAIMAVVLVIGWKLAGTGSKAIQSGIGLLAALFIGLNIENIIQTATGVGIFC
ncbi:hypothetical protein [Limnohabitans sp.]|uniref:hypothetical protein n=1 Tax=Limnohabitans sp. TaxID=1907725 RepID=UPI00286F2046|nr:hypothetical protein [Limnohabitans sp.]